MNEQNKQEANQTRNRQNQSKRAGGYGKRPMWQWVLIYLVVGALVYFLVYFLFFRGDSGGLY